MLNKFQGIGRIAKDLTLKTLQSGDSVTGFDIALSEKYTDKQGNTQEKTEWVKIAVFGKQAENCAKFLGKGSLVYVEGSLTTRKWQDQQGQDRYTTEIKAQRIQFLDRRGENQQQQQGQQQQSNRRDFNNQPMDDCPFSCVG